MAHRLVMIDEGLALRHRHPASMTAGSRQGVSRGAVGADWRSQESRCSYRRHDHFVRRTARPLADNGSAEGRVTVQIVWPGTSGTACNVNVGIFRDV